MLAAQISSNTELVYGHWDDEPVAPPPGPFDPHPESGGAGDPDWQRLTRRWPRPGATSLLGPAQIRDLAAALDLQPTKKLGQNFVVDAQHGAQDRAHGRGRRRATRCSRSAPASGR